MSASPKSSNTVWHNMSVNRQRRENMKGHRGCVIWFTGLSGSGKSTIAHSVEEALYQIGCHTYVFDGDNVRHGLCGDLGFSDQDRDENIRRITEMVRLFLDAGLISLTAFISPTREQREKVRERIGNNDFVEIYCDCPLEVCEQRDVKGLYRRARTGEIKNFTGISSPYEAPENADLVLDTSGAVSISECVAQVIDLLGDRGILKL